MAMHVASVNANARMRTPPRLSPADRPRAGAVNGALSSDTSFQLFIFNCATKDVLHAALSGFGATSTRRLDGAAHLGD